MRKLIPTLAGALILCTMSTGGYATEWMDCGDPKDEVNLSLLLGGLDFTQISGTTLRVGEEQWSDNPAFGPGQPLRLGDYYFDWKMLYATVVDENAENVLAEIRVVVLESDNDIVKGGVMSVPGKGLYVIACEGP